VEESGHQLKVFAKRREMLFVMYSEIAGRKGNKMGIRQISSINKEAAR